MSDTGQSPAKQVVTETPETATAEAPRRETHTADAAVEYEMARMTRRSLITGGIVALAGAGAWEWLRTRRPDDGVQWPLRVALRANEGVSRDYFRNTRLAKTFAPSEIEEPRQNGDIGLDDDVDPDWKMMVDTGSALARPVSVAMDDIKKLPKIEMITQLNCIEGWSRVLRWGGVRFRDFAERYAARSLDPDGYVSLETPDRKYYVGLDMASALHPQTMLCYEMNGEALPDEHGAPLRLVIPIKYGIKNLKRIGKIAFTKTRPPDFWAERGYDWYAGF